MKACSLIFLVLLSWRCSADRDFILPDKALIPEGTAFDLNTKTIYIGSIYQQKIIGIETHGKVLDVITSDNFGSLSPLGMEMDERTNTLWVNSAVAPIVNHPAETKYQTAVLAFDPASNLLLRKYVLDTESPAMLNDLTIDKSGNIYTTETLGSKIYWINPVIGELEIFCELNKYFHPNGIVYYKPQHCLFVATDEGICKIDLASKSIELLAVENQINTSTIDGLAIYDNYFIGHQSTKVSKFYFDGRITKITDVEILDSGKAFDSSTTGEIGNDHYYYIVNAQIKSGVNRETKSIKPLDSLENVIIRRKKL